MNTNHTLARILIAPLVIFAILLSSMPAAAQGDLIPISDVAGGSGIFILRASSKGPPRRVLPSRASRSKEQRIVSARKVSKQYTTLAKVAPRRTRVAPVNPNDPRLKGPEFTRMERGEASKLFAGVGEY